MNIDRHAGLQLTRNNLISDIPHTHRRTVCVKLDIRDDWKKFVGDIKAKDRVTPRYQDLQLCLFAREGERRRGSPTDAILNDWKTLRPTIGEFLDLLTSNQLWDSANYIHREVLKLGDIRRPVEHDLPAPPDYPGYPHSFPDLESHSPYQPTSMQTQPMPPIGSFHEHEFDSLLDKQTEISLNEYLEKQSLTVYSYSQLELYTDRFDPVPLDDGGRFLGRGGYGEVYLGIIKTPDNTEMVAVKRFHESSYEYLKQFKTELDVIFMNCHHKNLLRIKGICKYTRFCVVYEYMAKGTLEQRLYSEQDTGVLRAEQRLSIAIDIARGIARLHNGGADSITHRDIKPANILLDDNLSAKVGDYGLVRVQTMKDNSLTNVTSNVHGSKFYMPPEAATGTISLKWDVYSFAVVLLELLFAKGSMHKHENGYCEKMIDYIFDDEYEVDPLSLLDPKCDWDHAVARQLLDLVEKCSLKWTKRPAISGSEDAVLETLLRIEQSNRVSR